MPLTPADSVSNREYVPLLLGVLPASGSASMSSSSSAVEKLTLWLWPCMLAPSLSPPPPTAPPRLLLGRPPSGVLALPILVRLIGRGGGMLRASLESVRLTGRA